MAISLYKQRGKRALMAMVKRYTSSLKTPKKK